MASRKRIARTAREIFRLCQVDGTLDEARARTAARIIAKSTRRGSLQLLSALQRLVRLDRDRHTARIESATPLPDAMRTTLRSRLTDMYGGTLDSSFQENPALIGGVRITVGSDVYDGSVRARLAALASRL
jgi:F-type H+-transporting ATPase subunit delta